MLTLSDWLNLDLRSGRKEGKTMARLKEGGKSSVPSVEEASGGGAAEDPGTGGLGAEMMER